MGDGVGALGVPVADGQQELGVDVVAEVKEGRIVVWHLQRDSHRLRYCLYYNR